MHAKHVKGTISFCAALIAGVALFAASGAGAAKAPRTARIDVSTKAAVVHYLRSIHVNPKGVVIQRGAHNYAGARCPGGRWTCASTRHTVVQIAKGGGQNRFACRSSKCVVVQFSGVSRGVYIAGRTLAATTASKGNSATCIKTGSGATTGSGQSCTIIQTGPGSNTAVVYENTQKVSGLTQSAQYTALIKQESNGLNGNIACVTQNINLDGSTTNTNTKGATANLQAHQSVTINQDVLGSGTNTAKNAAVLSANTAICDTNNTLAQNQTLTSTITTKGQIIQNEDATFSPCGDTVSGGTDYANLCLDIEQNRGSGLTNASSGVNDARFTQTSTQTAIANTPNGPVTQTQSTPLCNSSAPNCVFPGGLVGTINQKSSDHSTANATQVETQCEDAATSGLTQCHTGSGDNDFNGTYQLTQNQYGPVGVGKLRNLHRGSGRVGFSHGKGLGASIQTGGSGNQFAISQTSTQDNDQVSGTQLNTAQADCTSNNGSCTAGQTTTVNNTPTSDGYTAGSITEPSALKINCSGQVCQATPPPAPDIQTGPDAQTTSTSANFTWTEAATAGVTLKCSIDGGTFTTCNTPTSTGYTGLSHGPHTFEVKAVDNTPSHNESAADSFAWEIIPYLTFEKTADGAAAGWSGTPGSSSITLKTGSSAETFAQFTIHDRNDLTVSDLALEEPTFTTDFYVGAPRYEIDLDNGDYLFGYPPEAGFGGNSWDINCGGSNLSCTPMAFVTWAAVQGAEGSATVTDVLIEADFPANFTYSISDFQFDGYDRSDVAP